MNTSADNLFNALVEVCRGKPEDRLEDIQKIRTLLTKDRSSRPSGYMNAPKLFSAYTLFHFPIHLPELYWILDQNFKRQEMMPPTKILDLGCGPGGATISALMYLQNQGAKLPTEVHFMDHSGRALEAAHVLTTSLKLPATPRLFGHRANLSYTPARKKAPKDADWLILSHLMNEWGNGPRHRKKKIEFLETLVTDHLSAKGGYVFIIEPPLREPTMDLMWLRDEISGESKWNDFFEVIAPCPRATKLCPMSLTKAGWCYAQPPRTWAKSQGLAPWDARLEKLLDIDITHPGFSYLVLRTRNRTPAKIPAPHRIAVSGPDMRGLLLCRGKDVKRYERSNPHFRGAYVADEGEALT